MARKMKDSGIEWIGEIPESWDTRPVKSAFSRKKEKVQQNNPIVLSLARSGVRVRNISNNEGQLAASYEKYNPVKPGDLLLNPMDLYSGANCNMSEIEGVISPAYINLEAKDNVNPKFFDYYFKTQYWAMAFFAHGLGVSFDNRWTLNNDTLMNYKMPVPSYLEQIKIAKKLDEITKIIDLTIDKTKQSIEEYKKYKQSLITEVVTKGLDPNVKMKDSGIEWIGEIPEHWEVAFLSQIFSQVKNKNLDLEETNLLSLSYGKIIQKDIKTTDGLLPVSFNSYNIVEDGDIILRMTDLQNDHKSLRVGLCTQRGIITSAYITIRKFVDISSAFAYYFMHSFDIYKGFYGMGAGVRQGLNYNGLKRFKFAFPKIQEQLKIVNYLDHKTKAIDNIIIKKEDLISELESYKKSLIYEVVTGKKEIS